MSSTNLKRFFISLFGYLYFFLVLGFIAFVAVTVWTRLANAATTSGYVQEVYHGSSSYLVFNGGNSTTAWSLPSGALDIALEAKRFNLPITLVYTTQYTATSARLLADAPSGYAAVTSSNATISLDNQAFADALKPLLYGFAGLICAGMVFFAVLISIKGRD